MTKSRQSRAFWTEHLDQQLEDAAVGKQPIRKHQKRTPRQLEHEIQKGFIEWVDLMIPVKPELGLLFAIPNGGHRHPAVGVKMKKEGVRRGVLDLCLPIPRGRFAGLWLETKAPGGVLSKYQADWIRKLRARGHVVAVCFSIDELITTTTEYLNGNITDEQGTITAIRRGNSRAR